MALRHLLWTLAVTPLLAQSPDVARMRADLDVLCSPRFAGRLSMTEGSKLSADYIAERFKEIGLRPAAPGFQQNFPLTQFVADPAATRMILRVPGTEPRTFTVNKEFRGSFWKPATFTGGVVFAGFGITAPEYRYDDYAKLDVRGKAVLIYEHEPGENDPNSVFNGTGHTWHGVLAAKIENAMRHGATAILLASEPDRKHRGLFDSTPGSPLRAVAPRQALEEPSLPVFQLTDDTARTILDAIQRPGTTVEVATAPLTTVRGESSNVVGWIEGSDPKLRRETIILSAHYDHLGIQKEHLYAGANDNGSGTVAVIELARLMVKAPPKRSVLFVVFGSEEELMLGSYYYVAHPLRPLGTTRAVINLDMIARDEAHIPQSTGVLDIPTDTHNLLNIVGGFYGPALMKALTDANAKAGLELSSKHDRDHDLNTLFRCDHLPFLIKGIPAVWLFGGFHPGYHEPSDVVDALNFEKLRKVTELARLATITLADGK